MRNQVITVEIRSSSGEVTMARITGYYGASSKCIEILPETLLESTNSDQSLAELDAALADLDDLESK